MVDQQLNLGLNTLYRHLFGSSSQFMADFYARERLRDVVVGPWLVEGSERVRQVSYTKPLVIPIPFAPKECKVRGNKCIELLDWACLCSWAAV